MLRTTLLLSHRGSCLVVVMKAESVTLKKEKKGCRDFNESMKHLN